MEAPGTVYFAQNVRANQEVTHGRVYRLEIDPKHSKTLLNIGIVRAFGKQDIDGAEKAWQRVLELAPNTPEAEGARKGLDGIRAGHGQGATPSTSKPPGPGD